LDRRIARPRRSVERVVDATDLIEGRGDAEDGGALADPGEPQALHEEREACGMIGVLVSDDQRADAIEWQVGGEQPLCSVTAAFDQYQRVATLDGEHGRRAVSVRQCCSRAEQMGRGHEVSLDCRHDTDPWLSGYTNPHIGAGAVPS